MCNMVGKNIIKLYTVLSLFFLMRIFVNCICLACIVVILCVFVYLICICCTLCVFVLLCVYCCSYYRCRTAGLKSVTGRSCDRPPRHRISWFPCVYRRMLRWFPSFQVATTCFSCSPPDLNFLVTFFIYIYISVYM